MKKKIITNTYLREAEQYTIKLFLNEDDYYISVKKTNSFVRKVYY